MKIKGKFTLLIMVLMLLIPYYHLSADDDFITLKNVIPETIILGNLIGDRNSDPQIIFATSDNRVIVLSQEPLKIYFIIPSNDRVLGIQVANVNDDEASELIFWTQRKLSIYNNQADLIFRKEFDEAIDTVVCLDANSNEIKRIIIIASGKELIALNMRDEILWKVPLDEKTRRLFISNINNFAGEEIVASTENKIFVLSHAGGIMSEVDFSPESISKTRIMRKNEDDKIIVLTNNKKIYKISSAGDKTLIFESKKGVISDFTFGIERADTNDDQHIILWHSNGNVNAIDLSPYSNEKKSLWYDYSTKKIVNVEAVDLDDREIQLQDNTRINVREILIITENGEIHIRIYYHYGLKPDVIKTEKLNYQDIIYVGVISKYFPKKLIVISSNGKIGLYKPYFDEYLFLTSYYDMAVRYFESKNYQLAKYYLELCLDDKRYLNITKYYGLVEDCQNKLNQIAEEANKGESEITLKLIRGRAYVGNKNYLLAIEQLFEVYKFYNYYGYIDTYTLDEDYSLKNLKEDIWLSGLNLLNMIEKEKEDNLLKLKIYSYFIFIGNTDIKRIIQQNEQFAKFEELGEKYGDIRNNVGEIILKNNEEAIKSVDEGDYRKAKEIYIEIMKAKNIIYEENYENSEEDQKRLNDINQRILEGNINLIFSIFLTIFIFLVLFAFFWKYIRFREDKYNKFIERIMKRKKYKEIKYIMLSVIITISLEIIFFYIDIFQSRNLLYNFQVALIFIDVMTILILYDFTKNYRISEEERLSEIMEIIKEGENEHVEFKLELKSDKPDKIAHVMIAFSNNTDGGRIFVGVNDDGEIRGLDDGIIGEIERLVMNIASDRCEPAIHPKILSHKIGNKKILEIVINEYEDGVNVFKKSQDPYIRKGSTTRKPDYTEKADLYRKYS